MVRILVVDDHRFIRESLKVIFEFMLQNGNVLALWQQTIYYRVAVAHAEELGLHK